LRARDRNPCSRASTPPRHEDLLCKGLHSHNPHTANVRGHFAGELGLLVAPSRLQSACPAAGRGGVSSAANGRSGLSSRKAAGPLTARGRRTAQRPSTPFSQRWTFPESHRSHPAERPALSQWVGPNHRGRDRQPSKRRRVHKNQSTRVSAVTCRAIVSSSSAGMMWIATRLASASTRGDADSLRAGSIATPSQARPLQLFRGSRPSARRCRNWPPASSDQGGQAHPRSLAIAYAVFRQVLCCRSNR
jgi:hypothetical protein